jgi:hypothetical protein
MKRLSREKYLWRYLYSEVRCHRTNSNPELQQYVKAARYAWKLQDCKDTIRSQHLEHLVNLNNVKGLLK